jgi:hypothetical protein
MGWKRSGKGIILHFQQLLPIQIQDQVVANATCLDQVCLPVWLEGSIVLGFRRGGAGQVRIFSSRFQTDAEETVAANNQGVIIQTVLKSKEIQAGHLTSLNFV